MNLAELKELARKLGGVLVVDSNGPQFVVLPYGRYKSLETEAAGRVRSFTQAENPESFNGVEESQVIEKLNREILALKEEIRQREEAELAEASAIDSRATVTGSEISPTENQPVDAP